MQKSKVFKVLKVLFGLAITVASIYFTAVSLKGLNMELLRKASLDIPLIIYSLLLFVLSTVARSFALCEGIAEDMGFFESWIVVGIGNALNMVLPLHAGEGVRFILFPQRIKIKQRTKYVFIPGVADMLFISIISLISTYCCDNIYKNNFYQTTVKIAALIIISTISLMIIVSLLINKSRKIILSNLNIKTFSMVKWVGISWALMLVSIFVVFISFGFNSKNSLFMTFQAIGGLNMVSLIPSSPGNLGIFEWSVIVGISQSSNNNENLNLIAIVLHLTQYLAMVPLGLFLYFYKINKQFKKHIVIKN